ncbi:MAG TPA: tetratricopeptide repeat protein, partial [Desulfobaccales bacterium]|nr:tetratricopeptide repeat protein [Desulfobaccales bacterium]
QVYQEALAREPDNMVILNNLGFSYYQAGNWGQAEKCFRQVLSRHPDSQTARNNLGLLLCRQGHREEARKLWQEAEGEAAAARRIKQAMAALGMVGDANYARLGKSKPGTKVAPAGGKLMATLTAPKAPTSNHTKPPASERLAPVASASLSTTYANAGDKPPFLPPQEAKRMVPPTAAPAPKTAAAKNGKPNITRVAAKQPDSHENMTAKAFKKKLKPELPKYLTAKELAETNIAILNGNGAHDLAHETRSRLSLEGFNVVNIGNYRDFGVARTKIYYRPDAKAVAVFLHHRFFPGAQVEPALRLADRIDVKVVLGQDLSQPQHAEASQVRAGKSL